MLPGVFFFFFLFPSLSKLRSAKNEKTQHERFQSWLSLTDRLDLMAASANWSHRWSVVGARRFVFVVPCSLSLCHVCSLRLLPHIGSWENMVPQSCMSPAALCVMVVLGEGMCDVYYVQIFLWIDRHFFKLQALLSNHPQLKDSYDTQTAAHHKRLYG